MTRDDWMLVAQGFIAFGTVGAVVIALFGDWLRGRLAPSPRLTLTVLEKLGAWAPTKGNSPEGGELEGVSRWYHVRVTNERRWAPATQAQVYLIRLEEPNAAGDLQVKWSGEVPLRWKFQEITPISRTIGSAADCDLCSVYSVDGKNFLKLHPLTIPFGLPAHHTSKWDGVVTLQARSIEADSPFIRVAIHWDGKWNDDAEEMGRHLVVKTV